MIEFLEKIIHRKYKNHKCKNCAYCVLPDGAVDDGYCNFKHSDVLLNDSACKYFTTNDNPEEEKSNGEIY